MENEIANFEEMMDKLVKACEKKKNFIEYNEIEKYFPGIDLNQTQLDSIAEILGVSPVRSNSRKTVFDVSASAVFSRT